MLGSLDTRWKEPQGSDLQSLVRWAQDLTRELRKGQYLSNAIGNGIPNSQLADMAAWTVKARNNAATGDPEDVNRAALTAATAPAVAHELLGFLSTNELRRFATGNVGGLQLLNSGTVTNQATLDIVLTSFTGYRAFKFVLSSFVPATDDVELWMLVSTDGGANYDASGYSYTHVVTRDNNATVNNFRSGSDAKWPIAQNTAAGESISNVAAEGGADAEVTLYNPTSTGRWPRARWEATYFGATAPDTFQGSGGGSREAAQDTNAVRFRFETGDIASGIWAVYGYA